jgi:hypothetical protein
MKTTVGKSVAQRKERLMLLLRHLLPLIAFLVLSHVASATTVFVKYRGPVDLAPFDCVTVERSSFIRGVCYDEPNRYMLVSLDGIWYHYCGIDSGTVERFKAAPSMGSYYNANIKGNFDCRVTPPPAY